MTRVPERSEKRSALDAGATGARRKASRRPGRLWKVGYVAGNVTQGRVTVRRMKLRIERSASDDASGLLDWEVHLNQRPIGTLRGLTPIESGILLAWLDSAQEPPLWELDVKEP